MAPFIPWIILSAFASSSSPSPSFSSASSSSNESAGNVNVNVLFGLIESLGGSPTDWLRLETNPMNGVRGVYLNRSVSRNDTVLQIPLASCLRDDDDPPDWLLADTDTSTHGGEQQDETTPVSIQGWVTRLAASLLQTQHSPNPPTPGQTTWLNLLPTAEGLRRSLPIYWNDATLQTTRRTHTSLSLAVDAARRAREGPLARLAPSGASVEDRRWVLDLVQTRACCCAMGGGVGDGGGPLQEGETEPLHVLAPVLDMINHHHEPNAEFVAGLDGCSVAVRALCDIERGRELCVSYGDDLPVWKCLLCYGFVPEYILETDTAELVVDDGSCFPVSLADIPVGLIQWEQQQQQGQGPIPDDGSKNDEIILTPQVGKAIVDRLVQAAAALESDLDTTTTTTTRPMELDQLQESHRSIFLACAQGLQEYLEDTE